VRVVGLSQAASQKSDEKKSVAHGVLCLRYWSLKRVCGSAALVAWSKEVGLREGYAENPYEATPRGLRCCCHDVELSPCD